MSESDSYDDMEWNDLVALASTHGLFHTGMDREEVTQALREADATHARAPDDPKPDAASGEEKGKQPGAAAQRPGEPSDEELETEEDGDPYAGAPIYQCHKRVRAVIIHRVEHRKDGAALIIPLQVEHYLAGHPDPESISEKDIPQALQAQHGMGPFMTSEGWAERFKGSNREDPGVWVLYEDGYQSWSPTEQFDNGYSLLP